MNLEDVKDFVMSKKGMWICGIVLLVIISSIVSTCDNAKAKKEAEKEASYSDEKKDMEASTLQLMGDQADLFDVTEPYIVRLVNAGDDGWQVRVKIKLNKIGDIDSEAYQAEFDYPKIAYLNESEVEMLDGSLKGDDIDQICKKETGESVELQLYAYSYPKMKYEEAKKIYDGLAYVVLSDLNLKEVEKEVEEAAPSASSSSDYDDESLLDADDLEDLNDLKDKAKEKSSELKGKAKEKAEELKGKAKEKYEEVMEKEDMKDMKEKVETVKEVYNLLK